MTDGMDRPAASSHRLAKIATLFWTAVLTGHATIAAAWWWLMPGGFPVSSPRFWVNRIAPIVVLLIAAAARYFWGKKRDGLLAMLLFLAMMWFGVAVALFAFFPITFRWLFVPPLLVALVLLFTAKLSVQQPITGVAKVSIWLGLVLGVFAVHTQKASESFTSPKNDTAFVLEVPQPAAGSIVIDDNRRVDLAGGTVQILSATSQLMIEPLLTFDSRSPDACWTCFATHAARNGPRRELLGIAKPASDGAVLAQYRSDFDASLFISPISDRALLVRSYADLKQPIFSHLNTFTAVTLTSVRNPKISFSPCADAKIDITYGDYPFGKPHRFAYLGADGIFKVVEASSAEKGPFHTLASGPLTKDESLTITLFDGDTKLYSIEFLDWASQLSTHPSPTAGWGVPENAIEFSKSSESPKSAVSIFMTLANTSVGRGFDSVGHVAGTYRNQMAVIDHCPREGYNESKESGATNLHE